MDPPDRPAGDRRMTIEKCSRHCEEAFRPDLPSPKRSRFGFAQAGEAIQRISKRMDCFGPSGLAMTVLKDATKRAPSGARFNSGAIQVN